MTEPQLWISIIELSTFYGLLALAFLVVYQGGRVFNFAIGGYAMLAGLGATWMISEHEASRLPAVAIGVGLAIAVAVATELIVVRAMIRRSQTSELPKLIAVAATLFAIEQAAGALLGRRNLPGLRLFEMEPVRVGRATLTSTTFVLVAVTAVAFVGVSIWLRRTTSGKVLRAVGDSPAAAAVLGLPIGRVRLLAFALAGLLAAVAGIAFSSKAGVSFRSGLPWALKGFLAVVVGGTGTVWAPLVGGFALGITEVFVPYYVGSAAPDYAILILAIVFFTFRPEGIFTRQVRV